MSFTCPALSQAESLGVVSVALTLSLACTPVLTPLIVAAPSSPVALTWLTADSCHPEKTFRRSMPIIDRGWDGITLTCAPKSTKNLQPDDRSHKCSEKFFEGSTTEATPSGWPPRFCYFKINGCNSILPGAGWYTFVCFIPEFSMVRT